MTLKHHLFGLLTIAALALFTTTTAGCSHDPVEGPGHTNNRPGTGGGSGNTSESNDPETDERIAAMTADASLRFDGASATLRYADPGSIFVESANGTCLEGIGLSTGTRISIEAPEKLRTICPEGADTDHRIALDAQGWQLTVDDQRVELEAIDIMRADATAVWIRMRQPDKKCHWAVIPREW